MRLLASVVLCELQLHMARASTNHQQTSCAVENLVTSNCRYEREFNRGHRPLLKAVLQARCCAVLCCTLHYASAALGCRELCPAPPAAGSNLHCRPVMPLPRLPVMIHCVSLPLPFTACSTTRRPQLPWCLWSHLCTCLRRAPRLGRLHSHPRAALLAAAAAAAKQTMWVPR